MTTKSRFGKLSPRYRYQLNPYPDLRFSKCLTCNNKTGQRKTPIVIHVDPLHLITLGYTHRYCQRCDYLIGHKHEIEKLLFDSYITNMPEIIGNRYLIMGTMDNKPWRKSLKKPMKFKELQENTQDMYAYEEIRVSMAGWFPKDKKPPMCIPPESKWWVKQ